MLRDLQYIFAVTSVVQKGSTNVIMNELFFGRCCGGLNYDIGYKDWSNSDVLHRVNINMTYPVQDQIYL